MVADIRGMEIEPSATSQDHLHETVGSTTAVLQQPTASASPGIITTFCEAALSAQIVAVQQREFSPDSAFWKNKASSWRAEVSRFSDVALTLRDCYEIWKSTTQNFPDFSIRVLDMLTFVDKDAGRAEVYANTEVRGFPPGFIRNGMVVSSFRLIQGVWLATAYKTMHASI